MKRRTFIKAAAGGVVLASGVGGAVWLNTPGNKLPLTIKQALKQLDLLMAAKLNRANLSSTGAWSLFQIFSHVAQSIEQMSPAFYDSIL